MSRDYRETKLEKNLINKLDSSDKNKAESNDSISKDVIFKKIDDDINNFYDIFLDNKTRNNWEKVELITIIPEEIFEQGIKKFFEYSDYDHDSIISRITKSYAPFAQELCMLYRNPDWVKDEKLKQHLERGGAPLRALKLEEEKEREKEKNRLRFDDGSFLELFYDEEFVKFPQHLIEITGGVEGYNRKKVTWENLTKTFDELINIEGIKRWIALLLKIDKNNSEQRLVEKEKEYKTFDKINSLDSFFLFKSILRTLNKFLFNKDKNFSEYKNEFINTLDENDWNQFQIIIPKANLVFDKIFNKLGDNFIHRENIHVMNGWWGLPEKEARKDFKKNMLTQKIFDPEIESVRKKLDMGAGIKYIIRPIKNPSERLKYVGASEIDQNSNKYIKGHKKDKSFLTCLDGLSVSNRGIWGMDREYYEKLPYGRAIFGFSQKNKAYNKYLKSCLGLLEEFDLFDSGTEGGQNKRYIKCVKELIDMGKSNAFSPYDDLPHPKIPIVIGHPDIPDLRWCHATNAYIPTKNGLNFIEMISSA